MTSIGNSAFSKCTGLTSVTIPNSVTVIDTDAFQDCTGLTSVAIGNNVTSIGVMAFCDCESLMDVYCYAEAVPSGRNVFKNVDCSKVTLHVPAASLEAYKNDGVWGAFGHIVALADDELPVGSIRGTEYRIQGVYDLNGRQQTREKKGVNILRYSDGTMKKVMVK